MLTVNYAVFTTSFAEHTEKARQGHSLMVMRHGEPYFIVAHPTLLTAKEAQECHRVTATEMYSHIGQRCTEIADKQTKFMITSHGLERCCLVPANFENRAKAMR